MNVSLVCLSLSRVLRSPFLCPSKQLSGMCLNGRFLRVERSFSSFLWSRGFLKATILDSSFLNVLNSPIHLSMEAKLFENMRYSKKLKVSKSDVTVKRCVFERCNTKKKGGGIIAEHCDSIIITDSYFIQNRARYSGAAFFQDTGLIEISRIIVFGNSAGYIGGVYCDGKAENQTPFCSISNSNYSFNHASKWTGALRIDHGGGSVQSCLFHSNTAESCGAFFDFAWEPSQRHIHSSYFLNNSAHARGGAFCAFHILHRSTFESCSFYNNQCDTSASSIHIESTDSEVTIFSCVFDKDKQTELKMRFDGSTFTVHDSCSFSTDLYPNVTLEWPHLENSSNLVSGASNEQPV